MCPLIRPPSASHSIANLNALLQKQRIKICFQLRPKSLCRAPECFDEARQVSSQADIWALGCTLLEMCAGPPFPLGTPTAVVVKRIVSEGKGPEVPPEVPEPLAGIIRQCLQPDPQKRPTVSQVQQVVNGVQYRQTGLFHDMHEPVHACLHAYDRQYAPNLRTSFCVRSGCSVTSLTSMQQPWRALFVVCKIYMQVTASRCSQRLFTEVASLFAGT